MDKGPLESLNRATNYPAVSPRDDLSTSGIDAQETLISKIFERTEKLEILESNSLIEKKVSLSEKSNTTILKTSDATEDLFATESEEGTYDEDEKEQVSLLRQAESSVAERLVSKKEQLSTQEALAAIEKHEISIEKSVELTQIEVTETEQNLTIFISTKHIVISSEFKSEIDEFTTNLGLNQRMSLKEKQQIVLARFEVAYRSGGLQKEEPDGTRRALTEDEFEAFKKELAQFLEGYFARQATETGKKEEARPQEKKKVEVQVVTKEVVVTPIKRDSTPRKLAHLVSAIEELISYILQSLVTDFIRDKRKEDDARAAIQQHQMIIMKDVLQYEQKKETIKQELTKTTVMIGEVSQNAIKKSVLIRRSIHIALTSHRKRAAVA